MARPRVPSAKAYITGYSTKHPERFRKSNQPPVYSDPIGDAPEWMKPDQAEAWHDLTRDIPWLNRSHGGITSITAVLLAKMKVDQLGISGMNLLRLCLGSMGATPSDFQKIGWSPPAGDDEGEAFLR